MAMPRTGARLPTPTGSTRCAIYHRVHVWRSLHVPDTTTLLSQVYVQLDNQDAPGEFVTDMLDVIIENSLHLPDVATLTVNDQMGTWVDDNRLAPGKSVKVAAKVGQQQHTIFDG